MTQPKLPRPEIPYVSDAGEVVFDEGSDEALLEFTPEAPYQRLSAVASPIAQTFNSSISLVLRLRAFRRWKK